MRWSNLRTSSTSGHLKCSPGCRSARTTRPRFSTMAVWLSLTTKTDPMAASSAAMITKMMMAKRFMSAASLAGFAGFGLGLGSGLGRRQAQDRRLRRDAGAVGFPAQRQVQDVVLAGDHLRVGRQHFLHGFQVQALARHFRRLAVLGHQQGETLGVTL